MTNEEYQNLEEGDVVRPMESWRPRFQITATGGDSIVAKPCEHTIYVDKAEDWQIVSKKNRKP